MVHWTFLSFHFGVFRVEKLKNNKQKLDHPSTTCGAPRHSHEPLRCPDSEQFACFAIGNASFHNDSAYTGKTKRRDETRDPPRVAAFHHPFCRFFGGLIVDRVSFAALKPAIGALVALLADSEEKTRCVVLDSNSGHQLCDHLLTGVPYLRPGPRRANAAGALGNLVRNSPVLAADLVRERPFEPSLFKIICTAVHMMPFK